jgi:hypothetical protein
MPTCPRCGTEVLRSPSGRLLEIEPHPLAVHRPDGTRLTSQEARECAMGRCPPVGHHAHGPGPYGCVMEAEQLTLFSA